MNRRLSEQPLLRAGREGLVESSQLEEMREEAIESLIAMLEMAVAQMGWIYRPPMRVSANRLNQLARLSAAQAAYALASRRLQYRSGLFRGKEAITP